MTRLVREAPCLSCQRLDLIVGNPGNSDELRPADCCDVCKDLDSVRAEIRKTKAVLEGLLDQEQKLRQLSNVAHASIVDRLPVEVAVQIFEAYVSGFKSGKESTPTLQLGAVCRLWRDIAWSTPSLWPYLFMKLSSDGRDFKTRVILAKDWLSRAGQLPLTIRVLGYELNDSTPNLGQLEPLVDILNQYLSQWVDVTITLPRSLLARLNDSSCALSSIHMHRLAINANYTIRSNFTTESSITYSLSKVAPKIFYSCSLHSDPITLNWANVTDVEMSLRVSQSLHILRHAPRLVNCHFKICSYEYPSTPAAAYRRVNHSSLQNLTMSFSNDTSVRLFFYNVTLTAMQVLSLSNSGATHPAADVLIAFFTKSSIDLKSLELKWLDITGEDLIRITSTMPRLQRLCVLSRLNEHRDHLNAFYIALQSHLSSKNLISTLSGPPLLPSLRIFEWSGYGSFPWELLPFFLVRLFNNSPRRRRPLKLVKVFCDQNYGASRPIPYISLPVLEKLAPFMEFVQFQFEARRYQGGNLDLISASLDKITEDAEREESEQSRSTYCPIASWARPWSIASQHSLHSPSTESCVTQTAFCTLCPRLNLVGNLLGDSGEGQRNARSPGCCDTCQRLSSVRTEIRKAKAVLEDLLDQEQELRQLSNVVHPSIVDRLPVEVAVQIFAAYTSTYQSGTESTLKLGAVCKQWRDIVWATPSLWATLSMDLSTDKGPASPTRVGLMEDWLSRAGKLPLTLRVVGRTLSNSSPNLEQFHPIIDILNRYTPQWWDVLIRLPQVLLARLDDSVCSPSATVHMDRLDITSGYFTDVRTPITYSLSKVAPKIFHSYPLHTDPINLDLTKLTEVDIYLSVHQCLHVLRRAPNLINGNFRVHHSALTPFGGYRHVEHSSLHSLKLSFENEASMRLFFDNVTLPGLDTLSIRSSGTIRTAADILLAYFTRSPSDLKSLELLWVDITGEDMIRIARITSCLERLCISSDRNVPPDRLNVFYSALRSHLPVDSNTAASFGPPLLPSLKAFEFTGYGSFPFELISAFLVPISKTSNGKNRGRPLDLIKIYSDRYPGDPIPHINQSVLDALTSCWKRVRLQHEVRHDDVVKVYVWEAA
ncbi:hypothetical protein CVT26_000321 [Gymnopilus dilepis]|uniref:F-box domain-containing protein n=1 Tax=Gymnopilus dilepis TaxID=231916 RepID=A0A409VHF6_9AGAR|nr:hypothetical protein CVT26_000321 [Gymnopilus dilepis]